MLQAENQNSKKEILDLWENSQSQKFSKYVFW